MIKRILILAIFCLCVVTQMFAQGDKVQKCKSNVKGGKYKLASAGRSITGADKDLLLFIIVKPENINQEFMTQLAKRLKSEYCSEKILRAVIFDDPKFANGISMADYAHSQGKIILMRGFYSFDRALGKDIIEFSSKRGNPTDENKIDFSVSK